MPEMQTPIQSRKTDSPNRNVEMKSIEEKITDIKAPLYSSPWLAFFYIIRQGWGQTRP